jgi:N-hydroxyarylamine O-acetyltransferase
MSSGGAFDLGAYLERIAAPSNPSIRELQRAHARSIPFENIDPRRGVPVSLEPAALQRKLVAERRGGYCFEQNLLLASALRALGARVELMLARVRHGAPYGAVRPRTHLALKVLDGDAAWHVDAGFGSNSPTEPLPFGAGPICDQAGWQFRIVEDGSEFVLEGRGESGWQQLYGFIAEPVPLVDVETSNWYTATHPHSPFVTGLNLGRQRPDGTRVSLSDWTGELELVEQTPERRNVTPMTREAASELLEREFGVAGFELDGEGVPRPLS